MSRQGSRGTDPRKVVWYFIGLLPFTNGILSAWEIPNIAHYRSQLKLLFDVFTWISKICHDDDDDLVRVLAVILVIYLYILLYGLRHFAYVPL